MQILNKGVNAQRALLIPNSVTAQIGLDKRWLGATIYIENGRIVIEKAFCKNCGNELTEMKRGGLACKCGYYIERSE